MKSEKLRGFVLVCGSLVLALCLLEIPAMIRVLDYRGIFLPYKGVRAINIPDPELLFVHPPHLYLHGERQGGNLSEEYKISTPLTLYKWDAKFDLNGFRNDVDRTSADMVVVGDSFVEGIAVQNDKLVTSLLARSQGKTVVNLGQSNYGPQQEQIVLKRYGLPLRPRTVLWLFSEGTDLMDVSFYDNWRRNPPGFWATSVERSFTFNALKLIKHVVVPARPGVERAGVIQTPDGGTYRMYFGFKSHALSKEELDALDQTAQMIGQVRSLCAAQGARLIFVYVPEKFRVFRPFSQFPKESECRNWVLSDLPDRMRGALHSIAPDIEYLDLTPSLMEGVKKGAVPYFPDDSHWSADGHRIAAETIDQYLNAAR